MRSQDRPIQVIVFSILLFISAIFMLYLGTMASAYSLMSITLFMAAYSLWNAWKSNILKIILILNQVSALALIILIAYRKIALPIEEVTLDLSGLALVINIIVGGPFMGILSGILLTMMKDGKPITVWLNKNV